MKIICVTSTNDLSFEILIKNDNQLGTAIKAVQEGWDAWNAATNPDDWEGKYFNKDDVESFYNIGFTEPAQILLDRLNIEYECISCYDDDGEWNGKYNVSDAIFID